MKAVVRFYFRDVPDEGVEPRIVDVPIEMLVPGKEARIPMAGRPLSWVGITVQPQRRGLMRFTR